MIRCHNAIQNRPAGVFASLSIGVASAAFLIFTNRDPFFGINAGFWALCANFLVAMADSLLTSRETSGSEERSLSLQPTQLE